MGRWGKKKGEKLNEGWFNVLMKNIGALPTSSKTTNVVGGARSIIHSLRDLEYWHLFSLGEGREKVTLTVDLMMHSEVSYFWYCDTTSI